MNVTSKKKRITLHHLLATLCKKINSFLSFHQNMNFDHGVWGIVVTCSQTSCKSCMQHTRMPTHMHARAADLNLLSRKPLV